MGGEVSTIRNNNPTKIESYYKEFVTACENDDVVEAKRIYNEVVIEESLIILRFLSSYTYKKVNIARWLLPLCHNKVYEMEYDHIITADNTSSEYQRVLSHGNRIWNYYHGFPLICCQNGDFESFKWFITSGILQLKYYRPYYYDIPVGDPVELDIKTYFIKSCQEYEWATFENDNHKLIGNKKIIEWIIEHVKKINDMNSENFARFQHCILTKETINFYLPKVLRIGTVEPSHPCHDHLDYINL
jgi:hypothetical protein